MTLTPHVPEPYTPRQAAQRLYAVCGELEPIYQALRDPVWFQDHQQRQLDRLRQELEAL